MKVVLRKERGMTTPEVLVLTAGMALLTVLVVKAVLPALVGAHGTVLNRVTNLTGSGF
ncbi:hypothetical protein J2Z49_002636 [Desulfofundulus luciae]|uniref:Flagellin Flp1-like domain-containing protein n=1 Tax=Desulfofundulus luciae TaxID=74702 RepID=A0ABU0B4S6_9FIRM|nr:hypothetical protein [Desulfofundulus luciae]MDQ0287508.1 hypothetical protein [Desulfofundulus luciae]